MRNYLNDGYGISTWLLTRDHKRIALLYLAAVTFFFFIGGAFAVLIRLELATPAGDLVSDETYNKLFTMHGVMMVFFFLIPAIPATLGNFLVPLMIGAKDLAFPKLNLASWYIYIIGGLFTLYALVTGGLDTGWTFYTPFSTVSSTTNVIPAALGIFINGFSSILTGLNFIVTIHRMRAPGMTWFRMPLFLWSMYATSLIFVLATPILAITILLIAVERVLHFGFFDPSLGGDPVLFQHLFWFYSHPAVYIMVLPSMGVVSELVAAFCRKQVFGYKFVAFASVAIAVLGFLVWGHHLFVAGESVYSADADALRHRLYRTVHHRRSHRPVSGRHRPRRARHRHLFRDSTFPLHHGGRHADGLSRRAALLVAEDQRQALQRVSREAERGHYFHRLQPDVFPAVHPRLSRHAAALPCVPA